MQGAAQPSGIARERTVRLLMRHAIEASQNPLDEPEMQTFMP